MFFRRGLLGMLFIDFRKRGGGWRSFRALGSMTEGFMSDI